MRACRAERPECQRAQALTGQDTAGQRGPGRCAVVLGKRFADPANVLGVQWRHGYGEGAALAWSELVDQDGQRQRR